MSNNLNYSKIVILNKIEIKNKFKRISIILHNTPTNGP